MLQISLELFEFGNLIRSTAVDDASLMLAFEHVRTRTDVLAMCNIVHGTPLDMAIQWKRDTLVAAIVPLYVDAIHSMADDDDDADANQRDYDNDPACHLLDALRTAAELGRVDSARAIVAAFTATGATMAALERRAPPGTDPILVNAVLGFDRSHEYPERVADCSDHGDDECGFDANVHRSRAPSEHSPSTSLAIVQLLIAGGVDVHAANEMETMCTGFCAALECGELPIALALLAHDASVAHTPRMHRGRGALQAAVDGNNIACVRLAIESCGCGGELGRLYVPANTSAAIREYLQAQGGGAAPAIQHHE